MQLPAPCLARPQNTIRHILGEISGTKFHNALAQGPQKYQAIWIREEMCERMSFPGFLTFLQGGGDKAAANGEVSEDTDEIHKLRLLGVGLES